MQRRASQYQISFDSIEIGTSKHGRAQRPEQVHFPTPDSLMHDFCMRKMKSDVNSPLISDQEARPSADGKLAHHGSSRLWPVPSKAGVSPCSGKRHMTNCVRICQADFLDAACTLSLDAVTNGLCPHRVG